MKLRVRHHLKFTYDRPVFVEPMTIRLRPRCNVTQQLERFSLEVTPEAATRCDSLDLYENDITLLWFGELQDRLSVVTDWEVTTLRTNPFDFLIASPAALELPFEYDRSGRAILSAYLRRAHGDSAVDRLAREILENVESATLPFLSALSERIHDTCRSVMRPTGDPRPPGETLSVREGACRDLAVLFVDACRSVGLAARFVSGYKATAEEESQRHLHAWAEVYLPGAGWRGYDPSLGIAVADAHVLVATAPEPEGAAPTGGSFRGTGARSHLEFCVEVQVLA